MTERERAQRILTNLASVGEDVLAFIDDVWQGINGRNARSRAEGTSFLDDYERELGAFLEQSQKLAGLIRQRVGIPAEQAPGATFGTSTSPDDAGFSGRPPHALAESFTFTRPYGFTLLGHGVKEVTTWSDLYAAVCRELARRDRARFEALPQHPDFVSPRGKRYISPDRNEHRRTRAITESVFVEVGMSANDLRDMMEMLLEAFSIPNDALKLYLAAESEADQAA